jgi:uncharacterized protein
MLLERLLEDIKTAMKARDKEKLETLRTLHSDVKNIGINQGVELTDEVVIDVIAKSLKQKQDSISQFRTGGRNDLVELEERRSQWLQFYMPQPLSEAELIQLVQDAVVEAGATGPKDMGKVMKIVTPKTKGKADSKMVSEKVKIALNS